MTSGTGGAPRDPAAPSLEEVSEGLGALRMAWAGEGLEFGYDRALGCWWAARGGPGGLLLKAARSPDPDSEAAAVSGGVP